MFNILNWHVLESLIRNTVNMQSLMVKNTEMLGALGVGPKLVSFMFMCISIHTFFVCFTISGFSYSAGIVQSTQTFYVSHTYI